MAIAHTFDPSTHDYITSSEDLGHTPANAVTAALPPRPWTRKWPRWTGKKWELVEDHRERKAPAFRPEDVQEATEFWLPGDSHDTPARQMFSPGPLPKMALLERPEKPAEEVLAEAKEAKTAEIEEGYQKAMAATLTMPQAQPTTEDVAVGAALLAADDPEGLEFVVGQHGATRDALLDLVATAESPEAVEGIEVSYAV